MAGTDEDTVAAADDALYVLTAVLLTPAKFPSVLGDDYPEACAALGLPPLADGYGLVLGQDGDGARWTVAVDDVSLVAVAVASWDCGMEYDLSPDERTVVAALPGWPLAVAVAAPGVPAPHDPDPESADRPVLSPPDTTVWGPRSGVWGPTRSPCSGRSGGSRSTTRSSRWRARSPGPVRWTPRNTKGTTRAPTRARSPAPRRRRGPAPLGAGMSGGCSRRRAPMSTRPRRSGGSGRRSRRGAHARCVPTAPAGRWSPEPTTSPSSCSTTNPVRWSRWAVGRRCPGSWRPSTRWPYDRADRVRGAGHHGDSRPRSPGLSPTSISDSCTMWVRPMEAESMGSHDGSALSSSPPRAWRP